MLLSLKATTTTTTEKTKTAATYTAVVLQKELSYKKKIFSKN